MKKPFKRSDFTAAQRAKFQEGGSPGAERRRKLAQQVLAAETNIQSMKTLQKRLRSLIGKGLGNVDAHALVVAARSRPTKEQPTVKTTTPKQNRPTQRTASKPTKKPTQAKQAAAPSTNRLFADMSAMLTRQTQAIRNVERQLAKLVEIIAATYKVQPKNEVPQLHADLIHMAQAAQLGQLEGAPRPTAPPQAPAQV